MIFFKKIFQTKASKQELIKNKTTYLIFSDRRNIKKQTSLNPKQKQHKTA